jgi:hypothetical protein
MKESRLPAVCNTASVSINIKLKSFVNLNYSNRYHKNIITVQGKIYTQEQRSSTFLVPKILVNLN